jgi:hypothetical protein
VVLWGAFALSANVAAGRVTFALGTAFGLAALVAAGPERAAGWRRTAGAAVLALLATAASPVAGLFVAVAAAALLLTGRYRTGWALAVPPPLVVLTTTLLFPFSGVDPISLPTVAATVLCTAAVLLVSPRSWRTIRAGTAVYTLGTLLTWMFDTPIGANVQRLGLLFGSVVTLAALCAAPAGSHLRRLAPVVAFAVTGYWTVCGNIVGLPGPTPSGQATGLVAELHRLHADRGRLEAVPMVNHWESWALADPVELARGWNRQVDVERNPLFYDGTLTAAGYHDWLRRWAVQYVALPEGALDEGGKAEAAVIRDNAPAWLTEVWHDRDWRLYRVTDARPLAEPNATVERAGADRIVLAVSAPGPVTVRIAWSPWLSVHGPSGACLTREGDWTRLEAPAPGTYRIDTGYTWPRGGAC